MSGHNQSSSKPETAAGGSSAVAEWAGRYQANVRRILEVTRTCFEIVPQTHAAKDVLAKAMASVSGHESAEKENAAQLAWDSRFTPGVSPCI